MKILPDIPTGQQITDHIKQHVQDALDQREQDNQYNPSPIAYHTHNGTDSPPIDPGINKIPSLPVSVANGGTGINSLTAHGVVVGEGTGNVAVTGAGTAGQVLTSNGSSSDPSFQTLVIPTKFGGTGADGALSGTTTINCGGLAVLIKNYSSVTIGSGATVNFSNVNASGTLVILRCSGNFSLTSSGLLTFRGGGGAGGLAGNYNNASIAGSENNDMGTATIFTSSKYGAGIPNSSFGAFGGGGASAMTAGTAGGGPGGAAGTQISAAGQFAVNSQYYQGIRFLIAGAGGSGGLNKIAFSLSEGEGAQGTGGTLSAPDGGVGGVSGSGAQVEVGGSGGGGAGGGVIYIEVAGSLNFTTSNGIDVSGGNGGGGGAASGGSSQSTGGSGGGAGAGGMVVLLYNTLTSASGTIKVSGGTGGIAGVGTSGNGNAGGNGGNGYSLIAQNIYYS